MSRKISQREARRLRNRVEELENERSHIYGRWATGAYPGVLIDTIRVSNTEVCIARTARKCRHAVVVVPSTTDDLIELYAVK